MVQRLPGQPARGQADEGIGDLMIHVERYEGMSYCTGAGETGANPDEATCGECLFHLITEALEGEDGELRALEYAALLAQLTHPELTITVTAVLAAKPL